MGIQTDIPTLQSIYKSQWPGDILTDSDYCPIETDGSAESSDSDEASDELEGVSEAMLDDEEVEDRGTSSEAGQELPLTEDQVGMLQNHVVKFRAADVHGRMVIVKKCLASIQEMSEPNEAFNRKETETLIRRYLQAKGGRMKKKSALKFGRKWTYADVVTDLHREEIHVMALSMSNSKAGSTDYLKSYRKALKIVEESFSEATKLKYRAQAKKWTEDKPPPRQQRKMMDKHGISVLRDFARYAYNQFGMRMAVLAAYCDIQGDPTISFLDVNDQLGGTSFKSRHEGWADEPMVQDFSKWASECFGNHSDDGNEESPKNGKAALPEIKLRTGAGGYPMLPSWEAVKDAELKYKKRLIGKYMTEMYQMASDSGKGRIPWMRLHQAQADYILDEYLPAGITLTQYHHIRLSDANALLQHWAARQAAGQIAFRFKKVNETPSQSVPASTARIEKAQELGCDGDSQGDDEGSDTNNTQVRHHAAELRGPTKRPQPRRIVAKKPAELHKTADVANPSPSPVNQPPSLTSHSHPGLATEEHSPKSVMTKPWGDKYNFLASLSKDRKYQDLLQEINQAFSSNHVIYVKPSTHHPAWARWTWTRAWLPEAFHSGSDKPVRQWLEDRPYLPDLSLQEGACGAFSADAIALGIGCLLRDMEAMQFSDECHPPQHVTHSKLDFGIVGTFIHPALTDFLQVVTIYNNNTQPAAPSSTVPEPQHKRRRTGQCSDDVCSIIPETRRSGRTTRPTERAKVIQEDGAVLGRKNNGKRARQQ